MRLHKMLIVLSGNRVLFGAMAIEAYSSEVGCEALGRHIKAKMVGNEQNMNPKSNMGRTEQGSR